MSELSLASAQVLSSVVSDAVYPQALLALNVLANSDIPLLLVDSRLAIRFITPAAASLLQLVDAEKEPLLGSIQETVRDPALLADAQLVLREHEVIERAVTVPSNRWYLRRIAPYRTAALSCDGLVITFSDITDRERVAKELKSAKQHAEMTSAANMRRLSSVCHDLRQPLNTLGLIGGLLAQSFTDPLAQRLAQLLDDSLQAISGMLSSAHYGSRLSAGSIRPDHCEFSIEQIFARLRREFSYHSGAHGLKLRIVSSSLRLRSDPALFEQLVRSRLEHLMKTSAGKVLVGCRRKSDSLRIEFWRAKRGADRRLPVEEATGATWCSGTEIAKKLADLLGCRLRVSLIPQQPVFVIELPIGGRPHTVEGAANSGNSIVAIPASSEMPSRDAGDSASVRQSTVFVIDDDDDICATLQDNLRRPGLVIHTYPSAEAFLAAFVPQNQSCLLVDANLGGMQGLQLIRQLNAMGCRPPTIMMSGRADIAIAVEAMKAGAIDFVEKPLDPAELRAAVERALLEAQDQHEVQAELKKVMANLAKLTTRQRQVLHLMLEGKSSKMIAALLFMSQRTVESHRANIMKKMNAKSLPELARMVSVAKADSARRKSPPPSDLDPLLSGRWSF
jgi:two-component system, chemotaxis family, CheB/CheR fusion protein